VTIAAAILNKSGNLFRAAASKGCQMAIAVHRRVPMVSLRLAAALAAVGMFTSSIAFAEDAKPNDAQIAHIAYTAGLLDIDAAAQAKQKSKNKDVLAFAADMERDHKAVNEKALALVKKLGVTPEDNDTSKTLSKQAAEKRAELAKLSGKAFDKAYIDNEVAYHKVVNSALQSTLIPDASNAELKDLLTTGLKIFQGHEQHAEHVAAEFK
jgi:putative membrane protein